MQILAVSDLHGYLPYIPECELLLLGGDYARMRNTDQQRRFFTGEFTDWLKQIPAKHIVGIAGNHDFPLKDKEFGTSLPWIYLQDKSVDIKGVTIYGTPWTPTFYDWAFMDNESGLQERFTNIPSGLDILLSHGPANGVLDKTQEGHNAGSYALKMCIGQVKPDSVICGHIHEARGVEEHSGVTYYNVSYVNRSLEPKYNPVNIILKEK